MKTVRRSIQTAAVSSMGIILLTILLGSWAAAANPIRVAVLPFYSEEGGDTKDGGDETLRYRRILRFINNQLIKHGFEVVNPFAHDSVMREYNRVMDRARDASPLSGVEMCKKYGTDLVYIVWLNVKSKKIDDGYCKAFTRIDGEGYDSAGHDLGAGVSKTFTITQRDCDDAEAEVEKEVADLVGRKLTAWKGVTTQSSVAPVAHVPATPQPETGVAAQAKVPAAKPKIGGGVLVTSIQKHENQLTVRLEQVTDYGVAEVFGKVVNTTRGVKEAKLYSSTVIPNSPQASFVNWRLTVDEAETEPFRLQANIMKMIKDITNANGKTIVKGIPYDYSPADIDMLKGIRPFSNTNKLIQFIVDRELVRDREMAGQEDKTSAAKNKQQGFE